MPAAAAHTARPATNAARPPRIGFTPVLLGHKKRRRRSDVAPHDSIAILLSLYRCDGCTDAVVAVGRGSFRLATSVLNSSSLKYVMFSHAWPISSIVRSPQPTH